jgi:FdhE protein
MLRGRRWEDIAEALADVRRRKPELEELLAFSEELLLAQHRALPQIDTGAIDDDLLRQRIRRQEPLLHPWEFPIDLDSAGSLFRALGMLARKRGGQVEASAVAIEAALEDGSVSLPSLLKGALAEEGHAYAVAHEHGLDPELLQSLVEWSLRPSLEACAERLGEHRKGVRWEKAICPICGSTPDFAELRGEDVTSLRFLYCGRCGFAWQFRRVGCPFCACTDHNQLRTLLQEGDERCFLEVCDRCHGYIKTVDNRTHFGLIPEIEAVAASPLDVVARDRGYA